MLDAEELAAIRGAIGQALSAAVKNVKTEQLDASPIALIADDQAGERARPDALRIAAKWLPLAKTRLLRGLGTKLDMVVSSAEIINGSFLRDELTHAWSRVIEVPGREGIGLLAVSGPVIESVAGRLLGSTGDETGVPERPPSVASLSVFARAGEMLIGALADSWREEQSVHVYSRPDSPETDVMRRELLDTDTLLVLTISVSGSTSGRVRLMTKPDMIVAPPPATRSSAPSMEVLERSLGSVPVEICVDLGTTRLTMKEISELRVGSLITLHQPVDAFLPIRCGGIVKAHGKPTIYKGALAVEIPGGEGIKT